MAVEAVAVSRQFFRKRADANVFFPVKETSITLDSGKLTLLVGASGSGKSTFLHMMAGILEPTTGKVLVDGEDIYKMEDPALAKFRNENMGVIPQGQAMVNSLTVLENALLPHTMYAKCVDPEVEAKAKDLLNSMGIGELADVRASELSGGEIRRVAIARALVNDPKVILADEPTSDLDDENTELVMKALKKVAEAGKVVLVVTHDKDVIKYADVIYRMKDGEMQKEG